MSDPNEMQQAIDKLKSLSQQPEQPEQTEEAVDDTPDESVEAVEETEQPEDVEPQPIEAAESETEESVEEQPEAGAETEAETYDLGADDLANLLGLKENQINVTDEGKIQFRAKVGDEFQDVNPEALVNAYQGDANLTNRSKALADAEKQVQAKLSELDQKNNEFTQQAAAILQKVKERYLSPLSSEELKELRQDDPAEYAARIQEQREREAEYNSIVQEAVGAVQTSQNTLTEETKAQYQSFLQQEAQKLRDAVPTWDKIESDVVSYAKDIGWSDEEIGMMADHRLLVLLHKARLYDKGKQTVEKKLKKPIPKISKPGRRQTQTDISLEKQGKLRKELHDSGSMDAAAALLRSQRTK